MLAGKLKDAATRSTLRPVDASKCICGRPRWGVNLEKEMRMDSAREGKEAEGRGKERK